MQEALIQFIWNHRLYNSKNLETSDGQTLHVDHPGFFNSISGPDFSEARIKIGDNLWVGQVEIHLKSSDWFRHHHQNDSAYNNVILHVVFEHDVEVEYPSGNRVPTLELRGKIQANVLENYHGLQQQKGQIPCASRLGEVSSLTLHQWMDRLLIQRLERKANDLQVLYQNSGKDLLQVFYVQIAGYLGQNTNRTCFQMLAQALPIKILLKHQDQLFQLEALLFGVAGLIDTSDDYGKKLQKEFLFLSKKYELLPILCNWKFGGIRPPAFPTRRLALLAALIPVLPNIKSTLNIQGDNSWKELLLQTWLSEYWEKRYKFGEESTQKLSPISYGLLQLIGINVISPFTYLIGKENDNPQLIEQAVRLLENLPSEKNSLLNNWTSLGLKSDNSADSQALIELTNNYCKQKKCLFCGVGKQLLSK